MNVRWTSRASLKINDTNAAGRLISIKRSGAHAKCTARSAQFREDEQK